MAMYMDGFHFTLFSSPNTNCLVFFFQAWTLDTIAKFIIALVSVFMLGVITEGIASYRSNLRNRKFASGKMRRLVLSSMSASQALAGYLLMLVAMTYSIELLLSVVSGIAVGYAYFFGGDGSATRVKSDACCTHDKDEEDDQIDLNSYETRNEDRNTPLLRNITRQIN